MAQLFTERPEVRAILDPHVPKFFYMREQARCPAEDWLDCPGQGLVYFVIPGTEMLRIIAMPDGAVGYPASGFQAQLMTYPAIFVHGFFTERRGDDRIQIEGAYIPLPLASLFLGGIPSDQCPDENRDVYLLEHYEGRRLIEVTPITDPDAYARFWETGYPALHRDSDGAVVEDHQAYETYWREHGPRQPLDYRRLPKYRRLWWD